MPGTRLTLAERAQIEVLFGEGLTFPRIAARIGRDPSTIWREVSRNNAYRGQHLKARGARHPGGRHRNGAGGIGGTLGGAYRWVYESANAHTKATRRARRPRQCLLRPTRKHPDPPLWDAVRAKLEQRWSPTQISAWLRRTYPEDKAMWVSHETIYQAIYVQGRGELRREIAREVALRSQRTRRRPQSRSAKAGRGHRPWAKEFPIASRPAHVEDRAVPGHWEGDLVIGARNTSAIITLVERTSRYVMLGALPGGHTSAEVVGVLTGLIRRLPVELARTLTWDQGTEMARHAEFTVATGCRAFFCDPHSPWQRGSNENTNGLLRQYYPRSSTDFRAHTQADLDAVARELNGRPRQTLGWRNPAEVLNEHIVATTT